jgi:AcrR family transcriptional regulator
MNIKLGRPNIYSKAVILDAALFLASQQGYTNLTRGALSTSVKCSPALISKLFGTMPQLRRAIMSAAVARSELRVIAQGLVAGDSKAKRATAAVQREALESLL